MRTQKLSQMMSHAMRRYFSAPDSDGSNIDEEESDVRALLAAIVPSGPNNTLVLRKYPPLYSCLRSNEIQAT